MGCEGVGRGVDGADRYEGHGGKIPGALLVGMGRRSGSVTYHFPTRPSLAAEGREGSSWLKEACGERVARDRVVDVRVRDQSCDGKRKGMLVCLTLMWIIESL